MAQDIVIANSLGALPAALASAAFDPDELGGGIVGGFGVLSYRGKDWHVKYRGEEYPINDENGEGVRSVEVVIVKSAPHLAKLYYANGYQQGSSAKPDCWSSTAVNPDPLVPAPQAASCGLCPMNAFGSRVTDNGKAAKACSDHKRVAIVPLADMANEVYGGVMLLRIPAGTLSELSLFANQLKQAGYPYFGVATRLSFDRTAEFPKLTFKAIRLLTQEEAEYIVSLRTDPQTARILAEEPEALSPGGEAGGTALFEQPPAAKPKPVAAAPAPKPAPAPAPKPAPAPAPKAAAPAPKPAAAAPAPALKPVAAKPVSPIGAAMAKPVQARPAPAPEPEAEEEQDEGASSELDAELEALLN